jgi:hypothetical protein
MSELPPNVLRELSQTLRCATFPKGMQQALLALMTCRNDAGNPVAYDIAGVRKEMEDLGDDQSLRFWLTELASPELAITTLIAFLAVEGKAQEFVRTEDMAQLRKLIALVGSKPTASRIVEIGLGMLPSYQSG